MADVFPIRAIGDRLFARVLDEEPLAHGLVLPTMAKRSDFRRAVVVSVGSGVDVTRRVEEYGRELDRPTGKRRPMSVSVGDVIGFGPMAGRPVWLSGDRSEYICLRDLEVLAVIEPEAAGV